MSFITEVVSIDVGDVIHTAGNRSGSFAMNEFTSNKIITQLVEDKVSQTKANMEKIEIKNVHYNVAKDTYDVLTKIHLKD